MSGLRGRQAVALVARREMTQRVREKSFLISMGVTTVIIVLVAVMPPLLGSGGPSKFTIAVTDASSAPDRRRGAPGREGFDAELKVRRLSPAAAREALDSGDVDAVLSPSGLRAKEEPDDKLTGMHRRRRAPGPPGGRAARRRAPGRRAAASARPRRTVRVSTIKPVDPERERKGAFAFVAVLALYTQLLTFGYLLASGVVEEKASRVVEVLLATIRPKDLLAGKIIGLGLLGLGQLA